MEKQSVNKVVKYAQLEVRSKGRRDRKVHTHAQIHIDTYTHRCIQIHMHIYTLAHTYTYINELHEKKRNYMPLFKKNVKYTNFKQLQVYINQMFNKFIRKRSQSLLPRAEESPLVGRGYGSLQIPPLSFTLPLRGSTLWGLSSVPQIIWK